MAALGVAANLSCVISKVHEQGPVWVAKLACAVVDHLWVFFKVARIAWVDIGRYYWCRHCLVQQTLPVHAPEPFVVLDIVRSILYFFCS